MSISEKILEKIRDRHIKAKPKWYFRLRDIVIWLVLVLTVALGSLSFAVLIFLIFDINWGIHKYLNRGLAHYVIASLPYFWLIILPLLIVISLIDFRCTKKGYKYTWEKIIAIILIFVCVFGLLLFGAGAGARINRSFRGIPFYGRMMRNKERIWLQPEKGLLAGRIIEIAEGGEIKLKSADNIIWTIKYGDGLNAGELNLTEGDRIRIIGDKKADNVFEAKKIQLWENKPWIMRWGNCERKNIYMRNKR